MPPRHPSLPLMFILALIAGAIAGAGTVFFLSTKEKPSTADLIAGFYAVENAVHVSPHSIRKMMDKGDKSYILVDLRSQEEYEQSHIRTAINIPAYSNPNTSAYGDVDRIVSSFAALPKNKDIIVYCYSMPCMTGRKIGKLLADHSIFVKQLGIGWNEWRYYWTLWNHEFEWNATRVEDYIASGPGPGLPLLSNSTACPIDNEFGC